MNNYSGVSSCFGSGSTNCTRTGLFRDGLGLFLRFPPSRDGLGLFLRFPPSRCFFLLVTSLPLVSPLLLASPLPLAWFSLVVESKLSKWTTYVSSGSICDRSDSVTLLDAYSRGDDESSRLPGAAARLDRRRPLPLRGMPYSDVVSTDEESSFLSNVSHGVLSLVPLSLRMSYLRSF